MKTIYLSLFILLFFSMPCAAQEQNTFWYKDAEYIDYQDDKIEVISYYDKVKGGKSENMIFHFNIYNQSDQSLIVGPSDIHIYEKRQDKWIPIELMTSQYYYRLHYSPESHYRYTNDDFTMCHQEFIYYTQEKKNDSTKVTKKIKMGKAQQAPSFHELQDKTHISTRYLGKTTLIRGHHASGVMVSKRRYRHYPQQIKIELHLNGEAIRTILFPVRTEESVIDNRSKTELYH